MQRATVSALRQAARQATPKAARAYSLLTAARALPKAPAVRRPSFRSSLALCGADHSARCAQATRGVKTLDFAGTKETVYERSGASESTVPSPLSPPAFSNFLDPLPPLLGGWAALLGHCDGAHHWRWTGATRRCCVDERGYASAKRKQGPGGGRPAAR